MTKINQDVLGEVMNDDGPNHIAPLSASLEDSEWAGGHEQPRRAKLLEEVKKADTDESLSSVLEKIVGRSNLVDIYRLRLAANLAGAVGLVVRRDSKVGTGLLISEDRIMTNWHVLETAEQARNGHILMDYERGQNGDPVPYTRFKLDPNTFFHSVQALDYCICAIKRAVQPILRDDPEAVAARKRREAARSIISLEETDLGEVAVDRDAFIIQHPRGGYKMIAAADNEIRYAGDKLVQYLTDTQPGSSGSPVFDEWFRLIALHHAGGNLQEPGSNVIAFRNQAINIRAIIADMPSGWG